MRTRASPLVTLLVLCATVAQPAHAADTPKPVVIARDGGVELAARDDGDQLCLSVRTSDEMFPFTLCEDAASGLVVTGESPGAVLHVGAAVPASATSVEVRRAGRLVAAAPTVAGEAYKGTAAGKVRFALVRLAPGTRSDGLRVHAKDAAGTLVAVSTSAEGDLMLGRRRLLRGRSGRVSWTLADERTSSLEPSVIDPAREKITRCVELTLSSNERPLSGLTETSVCSSPEPRDGVAFGSDFTQARVQDRCRPDVRVVYGVVPASVQRVTVLLGDGRRRSAPTVALRDGLWRAYAVAIARRDAVRGVTLGQAGAPARFLRRAAAPLSVICSVPDEEAAFSDDFFPSRDLPPVTPTAPVTTIAGSPAVRVADGPGDSLCLAIGDRPFSALGCAIVSPQLDSLFGTLERAPGAIEFALALPARVAAVRLSSADRSVVRTIPTVAGDGYAGRYAGFVRFAAAAVANQVGIPRLELLDAAGGKLHEEAGTGDPGFLLGEPRVVMARRIAGRIGGPSLWQTTQRAGNDTRHCLALTAGPRPSKDDRCRATRSDPTVLLEASCVTHRLTVAVVTASGTRVRADAGASAAQPLRLRNGVGLLTLPASRPLRALTVTRRGRTRRVRIQAPAAARQCGWKLVWKLEQG